jgi:hypothetical protein
MGSDVVANPNVLDCERVVLVDDRQDARHQQSVNGDLGV